MTPPSRHRVGNIALKVRLLPQIFAKKIAFLSVRKCASYEKKLFLKPNRFSCQDTRTNFDATVSRQTSQPTTSGRQRQMFVSQNGPLAPEDSEKQATTMLRMAALAGRRKEEAKMTGHLIRDDGGSDHGRFPWLGSYRLSSVESRLLADALRHYQVFTDGQFPADVGRQSLLAQIAADKSLAQAAPGLNRLLEKARNDSVDCIYVTNLPTERSIACLLSLTLGSSIGRAFNHGAQKDVRLIMEVDSDRRDGEERTEFDWHTEGAWIARDRRAEWVGLLGVENTPGSHIAYAPIAPVEQTLSARAKAWLHGPSACFRFPRSFALDPTAWSAPRSVLSRSSLGHTEIAWPGSAVRSAKPADTVGSVALAELSSEIGRQHVRAPIGAGSFLAFSNLRGVHRLEVASDGYSLLYKTFARHSLRTLQAKGEAGPIFSLNGADTAQADLLTSSTVA
jgi:hypothetical protein